jgi:hypothetical protein
MKVHTLLNADTNMPSFIKYTAAALHDQQFYKYIKELPDYSIIAFDKAYINYKQFDEFTKRNIFYVTRQKIMQATLVLKSSNCHRKPNIS